MNNYNSDYARSIRMKSALYELNNENSKRKPRSDFPWKSYIILGSLIASMIVYKSCNDNISSSNIESSKLERLVE